MIFEAQSARDRMHLIQPLKGAHHVLSPTMCVESFPTRGICNNLKGIARYGHAAFGSSSSEDRGNPIGTSSSTSTLPEETRDIIHYYS